LFVGVEISPFPDMDIPCEDLGDIANKPLADGRPSVLGEVTSGDDDSFARKAIWVFMMLARERGGMVVGFEKARERASIEVG
jgi:hypothetical protein